MVREGELAQGDERVWLIDRLRCERPVREANGKHILWEALAHPGDQASTKGPPSAGGDQRGARPATTACGAPSNGVKFATDTGEGARFASVPLGPQ
jgi:hypothetical protein